MVQKETPESIASGVWSPATENPGWAEFQPSEVVSPCDVLLSSDAEDDARWAYAKGQQQTPPASLGGMPPEGAKEQCTEGAPSVKPWRYQAGDEPQSILEARRAEWLARVEEETRHVFDRVARGLERRGHLRRRRQLAALNVQIERAPGPEGTEAELAAWLDSRDGGNRDRSDDPFVYVPGVGQVPSWYASRAKGLREKWRRIQRCGTSNDYLVSPCGCGRVMIGCNQRECPRCRKVLQKRTQKRLRRVRRGLRNRAKFLRVEKIVRERFVTFTVPHVGSGVAAVAERIELLYSAWARFEDWLRRYQREILEDGNPEAVALVHSWRVFEWTEGADGFGHPHFHVWMHGPYLSQGLVHEKWTECVRSVRGDVGMVIRPDMRAVTSGVEQELIKYMLKDLSDSADNRGGFVSPEIVARVVESMLRRRKSQTSRGLMALWDVKEHAECSCSQCGLVYGEGDQWSFARLPRQFGALPPAAPEPLPPD